ncbi:hypothetical protein BLNAU_19367 [Blattamonas nauphoetae]|uniref:Tail specific protease domain-containing protein n=1 Tax=Blattamonas nauphoetae TaxID=2049346 RepID=A0ABQ9X1P5_9EUKA|nr:hypothetical protein BLNAU_19367 [Blattamonas nauphoetae]
MHYALLIAFFVATLSSLPCSYEKGRLYPPSDVLSCFSTLRSPPTEQALVLEAASVILLSYPFADVLLSPPPPFQAYQTNVKEEVSNLKQIAQRAGSVSDFELHTAIHTVFSRLRDGHTQYTLPELFSHFSIVLPFPLRSEIDTSLGAAHQIIRVGKYPPSQKGITEQASLMTGISYSDYEHAIVTKIRWLPQSSSEIQSRVKQNRDKAQDAGEASQGNMLDQLKRFFGLSNQKRGNFQKSEKLDVNIEEWMDAVDALSLWSSTVTSPHFGATGLSLSNQTQFNLALSTFFHLRPLSIYPQSLWEAASYTLQMKVKKREKGEGVGSEDEEEEIIEVTPLVMSNARIEQELSRGMSTQTQTQPQRIAPIQNSPATHPHSKPVEKCRGCCENSKHLFGKNVMSVRGKDCSCSPTTTTALPHEKPMKGLDVTSENSHSREEDEAIFIPKRTCNEETTKDKQIKFGANNGIRIETKNRQRTDSVLLSTEERVDDSDPQNELRLMSGTVNPVVPTEEVKSVLSSFSLPASLRSDSFTPTTTSNLTFPVFSSSPQTDSLVFHTSHHPTDTVNTSTHSSSPPPSQRLKASILLNGDFVKSFLIEKDSLASYFAHLQTKQPSIFRSLSPDDIEGTAAVIQIPSFIASPPSQFEQELLLAIKRLADYHDLGLRSAVHDISNTKKKQGDFKWTKTNLDTTTATPAPTPIRYLILDMRGNGGGYANLAFSILPLLCPQCSFDSSFLMMPAGRVVKSELNAAFFQNGRIFPDRDLFELNWDEAGHEEMWESEQTINRAWKGKDGRGVGEGTKMTGLYRLSLTNGVGQARLKEEAETKLKSIKLEKERRKNESSSAASGGTKTSATRIPTLHSKSPISQFTPTHSNVLSSSRHPPTPLNNTLTSTSSAKYSPIKASPAPQLPHLDPNHFFVLSDGYCFSGCAMTTRILQATGRAKVAVMGGMYGRDKAGHRSVAPSFDPASATGANVIQPTFNAAAAGKITTSFFQMYFDKAMLGQKDYAARVLDKQDVGFPAQFVEMQADVVLPTWRFENAGEAYGLAVRAMIETTKVEAAENGSGAAENFELSLQKTPSVIPSYSTTRVDTGVSAESEKCSTVPNGFGGVRVANNTAAGCGICFCDDGFTLSFLDANISQSFPSSSVSPSPVCARVPYIPLDISQQRAPASPLVLSSASMLIVFIAMIVLLAACCCCKPEFGR